LVGICNSLANSHDFLKLAPLVSSIGEKAIVTFMEKQVIKVQGNSLEVGSDSSDLLFSRCHAVVHIRISVDGLTKTKIEAYAKRLDKRLAPVVCGS